MSSLQRVVMAIVKNAADDCRAAQFADPKEVSTIKTLAKRGILKAWKTDEKWCRHTVWFATYA